MKYKALTCSTEAHRLVDKLAEQTGLTRERIVDNAICHMLDLSDAGIFALPNMPAGEGYNIRARPDTHKRLREVKERTRLPLFTLTNKAIYNYCTKGVTISVGD